jgi:hypothetical protein
VDIEIEVTQVTTQGKTFAAKISSAVTDIPLQNAVSSAYQWLG